MGVKATPPKCDRAGCREQAVTAREIHMGDGGRSFDALCAAHAASFDLELSRLRELTAMYREEEE